MPAQPLEKFITVGKFQSPWGLKGEIKVTLYSDFSLLEKTRFVYLKAGFDFKKIPLLNLRQHQDKVLLQLDSFLTPESAKSLTGEEFFLPRSAFPKTQANEYYILDLIDFTVQTQDNQTLGSLIRIDNYGASDLLVILDSSSEKTSEILVPLLSQTIKKVSLEQKTLWIEPLEGLL